MVSVGPLPKADPPALFSRTAPKGMFGAHPGHSYGDPPGPSPAQLFQESGLLYLAQELPVPNRARAPRLPEQGGSSRAEDSSEEEGLEGRGEKLPSPAEQPGNSLHPLPAWGAALGDSFLTIHALVNLPFKSFIHVTNIY